MPGVALLTGASGFVGGHLADDLIASGWEVHALGRPSPRFDELGDRRPSVRLHRDPGDTEGLTGIVAAIAPSVCFHLASYFVAQHRPADVAPLIASNVEFPIRLAEALAASGDAVVVNTGTAWQHRDSRPYSPVDLYAATKQAFEDVLGFYATNGLRGVVNLKLFDTYGARDARPKLLNLLLQTARSGTGLELSPGEQLIDLVHVGDVVAAFRRAVEVAVPGLTSFAVSSGRPVTLRRLVEVVEEQTGRPVPVVWGARPYRPGEMFTPWDAGPTLPGWAPAIDLGSGIRGAWEAGGG
jgi:nucleoside-diphosphate-sugar epimerase